MVNLIFIIVLYTLVSIIFACGGVRKRKKIITRESFGRARIIYCIPILVICVHARKHYSERKWILCTYRYSVYKHELPRSGDITVTYENSPLEGDTLIFGRCFSLLMTSSVYCVKVASEKIIFILNKKYVRIMNDQRKRTLTPTETYDLILHKLYVQVVCKQ